jgi:hypothetical protein
MAGKSKEQRATELKEKLVAHYLNCKSGVRVRMLMDIQTGSIISGLTTEEWHEILIKELGVGESESPFYERSDLKWIRLESYEELHLSDSLENLPC